MTTAVLAFQAPASARDDSVESAAVDVPPQRLRSLARAAQHDILLRLAPLLREEMLVHLESLGMVAETLNARMERGPVAAQALQDGVPKMNRLAREALARGLDVCTWMDPSDEDVVLLEDGIAELAALLATSLNFRGFELRVENANARLHVCRSALRFLVAGAILGLVDASRAPGVVEVRVQATGTHAVVALECSAPREVPLTQAHDPGERPLSWTEMQALAQVHGVEWQRSATSVVLRLPRAVVTTPLKMIPV